jgi:pSer/pThr/pTyr-binding forkhead associated (FHA) protein
MITLHITSADGEFFDHTIEGDSLVIGRSEASDLMLHDRFLSRRHTRLYQEGGVWMIEDLGSRNGTWINGAKVEGPTAIRNGDHIRISATSILVHDSAAPALDDEAEGDISGEQTLFRSAAELVQATQSPFPNDLSRTRDDLQRYVRIPDHRDH